MEKTTMDVIRETIKLDKDGNVEFKTDSGRGRGRAIKIPSSDIDQFIALIKITAKIGE